MNPPLQLLLIRIGTLLPEANHLWTLIVRQKMKQSVKQWRTDEEERLDTSVGSHTNSGGKRYLNHNIAESVGQHYYELICKYCSSTTCLIWICRGVKPHITAPANDFLLKVLWVALSVFARLIRTTGETAWAEIRVEQFSTLFSAGIDPYCTLWFDVRGRRRMQRALYVMRSNRNHYHTQQHPPPHNPTL